MAKARTDNSKVFNVIIDLLATIRRISNKSLSGFCSEKKLPLSTLSKMENGKIQLTHRNLESYSTALGIDYSTILSFAQEYVNNDAVEESENKDLQAVYIFMKFLAKNKKGIL